MPAPCKIHSPRSIWTSKPKDIWIHVNCSYIYQDLTLIHPHFITRWITQDRVAALVGAQWKEFLLEQELAGQELTLLRNVILAGTSLGPPSTDAPVQVELIKHRLERAKLEVQLYSLALDMAQIDKP
jgi:hypothetical protein